MVTHTDVQVGQLYSLELPDEPERVLATYVKETRDHTHKFERERTEKSIEIDIDEFDSMRSDGRADLILLDRDGQIIPQREIDPLTILDPEEPGITLRERDSRLHQQEMLKRRQSLRFYVMRYDDWDKQSKGRRGLERFIAKNQMDALLEGHSWVPSPSSVLRAVEDCGTPNVRPLSVFLPDPPEIKRERRWPKEVVSAAARSIEAYWGDSTIDMGVALALFAAEAEGLAKEWSLPLAGDETPQEALQGSPDRERLEDLFALRRLDPPQRGTRNKRKIHPLIPTPETVRLWIRGNANWYNWSTRYGVDNANRRFRGRGRSIEATRPLEYVMFDHTKIDAWAIVVDDEGNPLFVARAWLTFAIDLYSRMILGAVIGYEPPSIQSVTACLRQVVRKKDFLLQRFGELKGACDGWGRPFTIIVDNGKEFVSPSFQASCEFVGIDVIWAPVKSPTFKPHVERAFGTFNSMLWHKLPGGLPLTPQQRQQLGLEPEAEAAYTKPILEAALWNTIATRYHLETQDGIGMAPALKWARGLAQRTRPTVPVVTDVDKIIGRSKMVQLSVEGVTINGNRFHDQELTTTLMNKLARFGKERRQRRGVTSSRTVWVRATWDPGDVTRVHIWDPIDRTSITLRNWDRRFSEGLSWYAAAKIREWAELRNQKFHSDAEKAAAKVAHRQFLFDIMPGMKSAERHRRAPLIEPRIELMPGDRVEMVNVPPRDDYSVQHDIAAHRADHPMAVKKGRPFGGKKGAAKAAATRARNRKAAQQPVKAALGQPPRPPVARANAAAPKVDRDAIRARVAARVSKKG